MQWEYFKGKTLTIRNVIFFLFCTSWIFLQVLLLFMFPMVTTYTYACKEPLMVELQVSVKAELRFMGGY